MVALAKKQLKIDIAKCLESGKVVKRGLLYKNNWLVYSQQQLKREMIKSRAKIEIIMIYIIKKAENSL